MKIETIPKRNSDQIPKAKIEITEQTTGKGTVLFPYSAEREYVRLMRSCMGVYKSVLLEYIPELIKAYNDELDTGVRADGFEEFNDKRFRIFAQMAKELKRRFSSFSLNKKLRRIAKYANATSANQWARIVKQTLGLDLERDYYNGKQFTELMQKWTADNVDMITAVPKEAIVGLDKVILEAYRSGRRVEDLTEDIAKSYNVSERRAELWARDQLGKLNYEICRKQQEDAGVTRYKWSSSRDERVRASHREFNGNIYSYDSPPEDFYVTKSRGRVYTGNRFSPGEGFNCRCAAIPVFDDGIVDIPVSKNPNQQYQTV